MSWYTGIPPKEAVSFRDIMHAWVHEKFSHVSIYVYDQESSNFTRIYYNGMQIAWIDGYDNKNRFNLGIGSHWSYIIGWEPLYSTDPELFNKIEHQFRRIGAV